MVAFYRRQRECVSLLRAAGHPQANAYPLAYLWNEVRFTRRISHARIATEAVVMQAVIGTVLAGGDHLKDVLEQLSDGE